MVLTENKSQFKERTNTSRKLFRSARQSIVGGVASKLHMSVFDEYPIYIAYGKGSRLYDVDGNKYIDYVGGFGPMILGYCPEQVNRAVIKQISRGSQFAAPTDTLNIISKKLIEIIPCADLITYQSSGTEANMVALRFARAYTGKNKIIKFEGHYHGWSDELMVSVAPDSLNMMGPQNKPWKILGSFGQREKAADDVIILPFNDINIVRKTIYQQKHEIAAVILEPVMCNCEVVFPELDYLKALREITTENNILLIFDEIITGFRLAPGGAQQYFDITPDLSSFGKAIAGGFPLAVVAGKNEIMEVSVHPVGTFNANPISIAACLATIKELMRPNVYEHMERITKRLTRGINDIAARKGIHLYCDYIGSIWQIAFGITERINNYRDNFKVDKNKYQVFRKGCLDRGIRLHPSRGRLYTSIAHTDNDVDTTLSVFEDVLAEMGD